MPAEPELMVNGFAYREAMADFAARMQGPVLQIGARRQVVDRQAAGRQTWRDRLGDRAFTGADLEAGENVDAVFDITWPLERIEAALPGERRFATVICAHLLEHVRDPFQAARNVAALLRPGGLALIQVPWVQAFHAFPDDYWRISFSGLGLLFPSLDPVDALYSGGSSDVAYRITRRGQTAFDLEARQIEGQVFQLLLPKAANDAMLKKLARPFYLSRGYMPATVLTWLARKPED